MIYIDDGHRKTLKDYETIREILKDLDAESAKIAARFLKEQRRGTRWHGFSDWMGLASQVIGVILMVLGAMYLIMK